MQEKLSAHLNRHAGKAPLPRYLNRAFESVSHEGQATFIETMRESRIDLRLAERDLGQALAQYHARRATDGEARFCPARFDETTLAVGEMVFNFREPSSMVTKLPQGTEIIVGMNLFKRDAEAALSVLAAHEDAIRQTGVTSITIGIEDNPALKGRRLGVCDTYEGRIVFFCDEHGGLLAKGLAEITKESANPCDFERAILHELAHLLEHNKTCGAHVVAMTKDIEKFVRKDPKQIPAAWLAAAQAINPEYLPRRFAAVMARNAEPADPKEAHRMAHEFLAEMMPAIAWQKKDIQLAADCPASVKNLHAYVRRYGHTFSVADKIKRLSTKIIPRDKNRGMLHSDYIYYHGGGPERWRSLDSTVGQASVAQRGGR
jgi:hypothetical protein